MKRTSKKECARRKVEIFKIWHEFGSFEKGSAASIQKIYQKEAGIEVPRTTIGSWIGEFEQGWKPESTAAQITFEVLGSMEALQNENQLLRSQIALLGETLQESWWTRLKRKLGL